MVVKPVSDDDSDADECEHGDTMVDNGTDESSDVLGHDVSFRRGKGSIRMRVLFANPSGEILGQFGRN